MPQSVLSRCAMRHVGRLRYQLLSCPPLLPHVRAFSAHPDAEQQQKRINTIITNLRGRMQAAADRTQPFVTLTYAQSLDGCISHKYAQRLMLSGRESAVMTHGLRGMHDTILVGIGTVLADDPQLTVRMTSRKSPLPVVLDSQLRTPLASKLVVGAAEGAAGTGLVVITTEGGDDKKLLRKQHLEACPGVHVRSVSADVGGGATLQEVLMLLKCDFGSSSVMVEGGSKVIGNFLAEAPEMVDFVMSTVVPRFVGGSGPATAFGDAQDRSRTPMLVNLSDLNTCQLGDDIIITGQPQPGLLLQGQSEHETSTVQRNGFERISECKMWVDSINAQCTLYAYSPSEDGDEVVALVKGDVQGAEMVPARVHSECFTGDILGSRRCDCGPQLHRMLRVLDEEKNGILLYVKGHEGRGIGLANKLRAYKLQDEGLDTIDANLELGLSVDTRSFEGALAVFHDLGVKSINLYTNNPEKARALKPIIHDIVPLTTEPHEHNMKYLQTKRDRLNHKSLLPEIRAHTLASGRPNSPRATSAEGKRWSTSLSRRVPMVRPWQSEPLPQLPPASSRSLHASAPRQDKYTVQVKDRAMLAHSFHGDEFGPAQKVIFRYDWPEQSM